MWWKRWQHNRRRRLLLMESFWVRARDMTRLTDGWHKTVKLSIKIILCGWRQKKFLSRIAKTHYRLWLGGKPYFAWNEKKNKKKTSIEQVKRRFNAQMGKIKSNGFVTESPFIGFCQKDRKKLESHIWASCSRLGLNLSDIPRSMYASNKKTVK